MPTYTTPIFIEVLCLLTYVQLFLIIFIVEVMACTALFYSYYSMFTLRMPSAFFE